MAYGAARHETEDQSVSCLPRSWATSHPEIGTRVTKENIISMFILTTRPLFFSVAVADQQEQKRGIGQKVQSS